MKVHPGNLFIGSLSLQKKSLHAEKNEKMRLSNKGQQNRKSALSFLKTLCEHVIF